MDQELSHALCEEIRKKKELQSLSLEFVQAELEKYLQEVSFDETALTNPRSKQYKQLVKDVRSRLRRMYGLFRIEEGRKEREVLLTKMKEKGVTKETVLSLLETHSSTKERVAFYEEMYTQIWEITGKPSSILDLGCGLNPLSVPLMNLNQVTYHAYDISETEINLINTFFSLIPAINGGAAILDIRDLGALPMVDVAFLFKVTDILDQGKGHKKTEETIESIPARFVVVSFPTKTMSGKKMNAPRRRWMEWLCERREWEFTVLEFENEIFYVVKRDG